MRRHTSVLFATVGILAVGTAAIAGSGVGSVFNLGQTNTVDALTALSGTTPQLLKVTNGSSAADSMAIYGISSGGVGVMASSPVRGLRAIASRTIGVNYGIQATTASRDGFAGYFKNTGTSPAGVDGVAVQGFSAEGSVAFVHPNNAYYDAAGEFSGPNGVIGAATKGNGVTGVAAPGSIGVYGVSNEATGSGVGVNGTSFSPNGYGGFFQNSGSGIGLTAWTGGASDVFDTHPNGALLKAAGEFAGVNGVIGAATTKDGYGVVGRAVSDITSTSSIGVYAVAPLYGSGYALGTAGNAYISGSLAVSGLLTKGAGTFKIDHPLDPENKYLSHSFVESPDMMNIYNGNVTTDAEGAAIVELPSYFEALNRDPRYQLTVIGSFAAAQIAEEVSDHRFVIRTSEPNVKVSWQVTGIRQDAFAQQHPVVVEEDKAVADRGRYLHPEAFGKPASLAIGAEPPQVASAAAEATMQR